MNKMRIAVRNIGGVMELEKAKILLKEMQETNRAWLKETKEENCEKIYLRDIEAIETVLQALDNSIPKEKVKKVFDTKIYNTNYLAETDWTDYQREVDLRVADLLKVIKQELLEE